MWDVYDENGNWLGTAPGVSEEDALSYAKSHGMSEAASAQPCSDE